MLSADHIELLRAHIHRESEEWVREYVQRRREVLERTGTKASSALIDSLSFALHQVTGSAITNTIELAFAEHGRYVDMKRLQPAKGGSDYIQELAAWIVEKGLYQKFVQRYLDTRNLRNPPENILQQLAWAAAKRRAERTPRRKKWYAASSTGAVTDLFNRVAEGMPDIIINELKKGFQDGSPSR